MVNTSPELPPADSPNLTLLHPTPQEKLATWTLNGQAWRGSMDISTYLRREAYLENQDFTTSGGITFWILVDATLPPDARPILSSCESLRKRAVIARTNGKMAEITSHGIASVFCNPKYRRRGYTQRMITELGKKLDNWQQKDGERANFTVLYSDIGKVWELAPLCLRRVSKPDRCSRYSIRDWDGTHFYPVTLRSHQLAHRKPQ